MSPTEFTFFSVTLFLALVALLEWKRRREVVRKRLSRGLKGFVANTPPAPVSEIEPEDDASRDSLAVVQ